MSTSDGVGGGDPGVPNDSDEPVALSAMILVSCNNICTMNFS